MALTTFTRTETQVWPDPLIQIWKHQGVHSAALLLRFVKHHILLSAPSFLECRIEDFLQRLIVREEEWTNTTSLIQMTIQHWLKKTQKNRIIDYPSKAKSRRWLGWVESETPLGTCKSTDHFLYFVTVRILAVPTPCVFQHHVEISGRAPT